MAMGRASHRSLATKWFLPQAGRILRQFVALRPHAVGRRRRLPPRPGVGERSKPAAYDRYRGSAMTALGFALLLTGVVLVIAEAHVPGGVLGVAGGLALIAGG